MSVWALIMAAGSGARMGLGHNKVLEPLADKPLLAYSIGQFAKEVDGILIIARREDVGQIDALDLGLPVIIGGETRQQSVLNGLKALPREAQIVLVHDAARPFIDRDIIRRCIQSVQTHGSGVVGVPVKDTVKQARTDGTVLSTPPRDTLWVAQTPQGFFKADLKNAIERLEAQGDTATDDASAMELMGYRVRLVKGSYANIKMTTPEDMAMAEGMLGVSRPPRVGQGYDVHRLVEDRKLILCGIEVPYEKGLLGHSDADVALHALMDAMLGAAALGDIGKHFPDTDARYKGISSVALLKEVAALLKSHRFAVQNADITIVAQQPKMLPYIEKMAENVARVLGIQRSQVNVKATTTEGLGFEGEGLGISAHAIVMVG